MENQTVIIPCPACQKTLKLKQAVNVGKKLRCPSCNHGFLATEEMIRPATAKPTPRQRPAAQAPIGAQQPVAPPAKNSTATAIYVASGVILLAAIIFAAPQFFNSNKSQAENSDKNVEKKDDAEKKEKQDQKSDNVTPAKVENKQEEKKEPEKKADPIEEKTEPKKNNEDTKVPDKVKSNETDDKGEPKKAVEDPDRPGDKDAVKNPLKNDDDPDRPQDKDPVVNDAADLKAIGGLAGFQKLATSPPPPQRFSRPFVIVQVPRPAPTTAPKAGTGKAKSATKAKSAAKPVVTVDFQPKPTTPLLLDERANPGVTVNIDLNLTATPPSPVTVDVTTPTGIISNLASVTFPANVAPTKQTITLTGDGTGLGTVQSKLDRVVFSAKSAGLTAGNTTNYPIRVVRRTRYVIFDPTSGFVMVLARADTLGLPTRTDLWVVFFPGTTLPPLLAGTAPTTASQYYTSNHVEIVEQGTGGLRFRLTDTGVTWQTAVGSPFVPVPFMTGWVTSWQ